MFKPFKQFLKDNEKDIILITGVILISLISFGVGRLSVPGIPKQTITFENFSSQKSLQADILDNITDLNINQEQSGVGDNIKGNSSINTPQNCLFVASKNSDKYHLPWCSGAKRIKEENKICFNSKEEAESRGYIPANNCADLNN